MNTSAQEVLQAARVKYDRATASYWQQRDNGGITELDPLDPDESDDIAAGAKFKARTPAGATVLGAWQRCKAELDAAAANLRRERGDRSCPVCPGEHDGLRAVPADPVVAEDRRLPPERDDEAGGPGRDQS